MKKLFALILTIVLCFYAVGAVTENEKLEAGNPVATTPETPEGMTADEVCGFVYFVPNGWTEDVNDVHESEKVYRINPDDNSAVLSVICIDTTDKFDMTPSSYIIHIGVGIVMRFHKDFVQDVQEEEVVIELIKLRNITGYLMTTREDQFAFWLTEQRDMAICIELYLEGASMEERRSMMLRVLGVTEDEVETADNNLFASD